MKHREKEDPHFGDLRVGWEKVRGEIQEIFGNVEGKGDVAEGIEKLEIKEEAASEVKDEVKIETKVKITAEVKTETNEKETVIEKNEEVKVNVEEFLVESEGGHKDSEGKSEGVKA